LKSPAGLKIGVEKAQHGQKKDSNRPLQDMMEIWSLKTFYWHCVNKI
jgi:hypothetical protein